LLKARESFPHYSKQWDELNAIQGSPILLDSAFVAPLVRAFATDNTLLAISGDKNQPTMALLNPNRMGFWQTFQPGQAPLGLVVIANTKNVTEQIYNLVYSLPGFALGFAVLQQDPDWSSFSKLESSRKIEKIGWRTTARVTLEGTFADYWRRRGRKLVRELARQRRRLAESGATLEMVATRDPYQVADCIREYGMIEGNGWKGQAGTAVSENNQQGMFYREMLENFCRRDEGVIYRLLLNGRTVACELCIQRGESLVDLKTTYDETIPGISPGSLLQEEMLRAFFNERHIRVVEFYGPVIDWTRRWTDEFRDMCHVNFYRYGWVRQTRNLLKRVWSGTRATDTGWWPRSVDM
jgi:hypothetical protein